MKAKFYILNMMIMMSIWFGNEKVFSNEVIGRNDTLIMVNFVVTNRNQPSNKVTVLNFAEENTVLVKIDTTRDDFIVISERICFNERKTFEKDLKRDGLPEELKIRGGWNANLISFDLDGEGRYPLQFYRN